MSVRCFCVFILSTAIGCSADISEVSDQESKATASAFGGSGSADSTLYRTGLFDDGTGVHHECYARVGGLTTTTEPNTGRQDYEWPLHVYCTDYTQPGESIRTSISAPKNTFDWAWSETSMNIGDVHVGREARAFFAWSHYSFEMKLGSAWETDLRGRVIRFKEWDGEPTPELVGVFDGTVQYGGRTHRNCVAALEPGEDSGPTLFTLACDGQAIVPVLFDGQLLHGSRENNVEEGRLQLHGSIESRDLAPATRTTLQVEFEYSLDGASSDSDSRWEPGLPTFLRLSSDGPVAIVGRLTHRMLRNEQL